MNETQIYPQAFAVYLKESPADPEKAAQQAKEATRIALAVWHQEPKKEGVK